MTAKFFAGIFILSVCLSACGVEPLLIATQTATEIIELLPATEITSTLSPRPTPTLALPNWTPSPRVIELDGVIFPNICGHGGMLSPNKELVAISCGGKRDQTLKITSKQGLVWKLDFLDYLPKWQAQNGTPGGLAPILWTSDSKYLYFYSVIGYSGGGVCFYRTGHYEGLFRLNTDTGEVLVVLPPIENTIAPYEFAFSPTGRRFVYEGLEEPRIVDLLTGAETIIHIPDGFASGNYTWSPDGSELAYSICDAVNIGEGQWIEIESAIKIFSIPEGESRTILREYYNFMTISSWNQNNILEIESYDTKKFKDSIILIDMSTEQAVTPTPTP